MFGIWEEFEFLVQFSRHIRPYYSFIYYENFIQYVVGGVLSNTITEQGVSDSRPRFVSHATAMDPDVIPSIEEVPRNCSKIYIEYLYLYILVNL